MFLPQLLTRAEKGEKLTALTCYDASFARLLAENGIDILLVGDSLGMTVQGHATTLPVTLVMLEAVRDWRELTGTQIGVKPAGGIRTTKDAMKYLVMVNEIAGPDWLTPDWFRFGASGLLGDLLLQRQKLATGAYSGPDYVTID